MADKVRTVAFQFPTGSGTFDVTLSGFGTPNTAIVYLCGDDTPASNSTANRNSRISIGVVDDDGHQACLVGRARNTRIPTEVRSWLRTDRTISHIDNGGSEIVGAEFDSFITDGIRLNRLTEGGPHYGFVKLIQCAESELVSVDNTGGQIAFGPGFRPTWVCGISTDTTVGAGSDDTSRLMVGHGFAVDHSPVEQISTCFSWEDNVSTSNATAYCSDIHAMREITSAQAEGGGWDIAFTPTGGTIDQVNGAGMVGSLLCVRFGSSGDVKIGTFSSHTSDGNSVVSGLGIDPNDVLFLGTQLTPSEWNTPSGGQGAGSWGYGGASAAGSAQTIEQAAVCYYNEDAEATQNDCFTGQNFRESRCFAILRDDGDANVSVLKEAFLTSFDTGGFTVDWSISRNAMQQGFVAFLDGDTQSGDSSGNSDVPASTGSGQSQSIKNGTGASTSGAATSSGSAGRGNDAFGNSDVGIVTSSGAGVIVHPISGMPVLPKPTSSGLVDQSKDGTGGSDVGAAVSVGTSDIVRAGTGTSSTGAATSTGVGESGVKSGQGGSTLGATTSTGSAQHPLDATGASTIAPVGSSSFARYVYVASGNSDAGAATSTGTGASTEGASGNSDAGAATSSGQSTIIRPASGNSDVAATTSSGTGLRFGVNSGGGDSPVPALTSSGVALRVVVTSGASQLGPVRSSGQSNFVSSDAPIIELTLPIDALIGSGTDTGMVEISVADAGTDIRMTITRRGSPMNFTGVAVAQHTLILRAPSGATKNPPLAYLTDGSDGILRLLTTSSTFDEPGVWSLQVLVSRGGQWYSKVWKQRIRANVA